MKYEQNITAAIASIHMPDKDMDMLQETLIQAYKNEEENSLNSRKEVTAKQSPNTLKRRKKLHRFAIAAAFILCIIVVPVTAYAAIHFQWFSLFFENTDENDSVLKELSQYMNTEQTITETEDYKITVKGNLYSSKQQMGLIVCSIIMKKDDNQYFVVMDHKKERYLSKTGETKLFKTGSYILSFSHHIGDTFTMYYDGETAADGGYLCGIRYNTDSAPEKLALTQSYGDSKRTILAEISIPKPMDMPTTTFFNSNFNNTTIILSPLGITFHNLGSGKNQLPYDNTSDGSAIQDTTKLILKREPIAIADIATDSLHEGMSISNSYEIYQEFNELICVQDVTEVQIDSTSEGNTISFKPE